MKLNDLISNMVFKSFSNFRVGEIVKYIGNLSANSEELEEDDDDEEVDEDYQDIPPDNTIHKIRKIFMDEEGCMVAKLEGYSDWHILFQELKKIDN